MVPVLDYSRASVSRSLDKGNAGSGKEIGTTTPVLSIEHAHKGSAQKDKLVTNKPSYNLQMRETKKQTSKRVVLSTTLSIPNYTECESEKSEMTKKPLPVT